MGDDAKNDEDREDSGLTWLYGSSSATPATTSNHAAPSQPFAASPESPQSTAPTHSTESAEAAGMAEIMPSAETVRRPRRTPPPQSVIQPSQRHSRDQTGEQVGRNPADNDSPESAPLPIATPASTLGDSVSNPRIQNAPNPTPKASKDVEAVSLLDNSRTQTRSSDYQDSSSVPPAANAGGEGATKKHLLPRPARLTITFIATLIVTYIVTLIAIPLAAWSGVSRIDSEPAAGHVDDTPGTAILLVGSDSRDAMTEEERAQLGVGDASGGRTDTMMIYFIPETGRPVLLSLPRDTYIYIPGVGYNKLNAAYAYGGAPLLAETVEKRTGIHLDGYLEVGMAQFASLIDFVGGLDVCIDYDVADPDSNLYLNAGCHHLDGAQGLAYVRMRYADPRGDLGRIERQREAISQVMNKLAVKSNVLLPWRWYGSANAVMSLLTAGNDTSIFDMFSAGLGALDFASGNGLQLTVPIADPGAATEVGSSVIWDDDAADELFAIIRSGDTTGAERFAK